MTRLEGRKYLQPILFDAELSIYGGSYSGQKSYLAPFSRYLHIYAPNRDFMHIFNILTLAGPITFSWTYSDAEWSIYGGSSPGQKFVSRTV